MPPKPKFTKEEIIDVAIELVREKGASALTARELGARLSSSARPIFTVFENMSQLNEALIRRAVEIFRKYSENFKEYTPAFKQMGMQIVSFACEESRLFELLFMHKSEKGAEGLSALANDCIEIISKEHDISLYEAKMLFDQVWTFTFGLSTLCAMNVYSLSETEISDMLTRQFTGSLMMIKSDSKKYDTAKPIKRESV